LQDFRSSQRFFWDFQSSEMSCFLTGSLVFRIWKYHCTSFFKGKQSKQNVTLSQQKFIYILYGLIIISCSPIWCTFYGLTECKMKTLYHVPEDLNLLIICYTMFVNLH
jgi:hypothetical protein